MWRSTDGVDSWTLLDSPTNVAAIAVSSEYLYVVRDFSLFRSADQGETWREINKQIGSAQDILLVPTHPSIMYIRIGGELYVSKDGGFSWTLIRDANSSLRIADFAIDSADPPSIYVGVTNRGLLRANALNPEEWSVIALPSEPGNFHALATHPSDPDVLAVAIGTGVFATLDGGASWVPLHEAGHLIGNVTYEGLPYTSGRPIVVMSGSPWTICIGSDTGVWCHGGVEATP